MSTLKIEAYSLFEFCQLVQNAILEGWRFDFDNNDHFPTAFGSLLVAGMVSNQVPQTETETEQETSGSTRGRKPKVA